MKYNTKLLCATLIGVAAIVAYAYLVSTGHPKEADNLLEGVGTITVVGFFFL